MKNLYPKLLLLGITLILGNLSFAQVFMTELADPDNNAGLRYIELYNAGDTPVDFTEGDNWRIDKYRNGDETVTQTLNLTGTIPAKGFYIIATGEEDTDFETAYGMAPDQFDGSNDDVAGSNGDDNLELYNGNNELIDQFGVPGEDGSGTEHEFEDGRAERKASVTTGNATWDVDEWNIDNDAGEGDGPVDAPDGFDPGSWIGVSDAEAPVFMAGYPKTSIVLDNKFNLDVKVDEPSTLYYVVLADGSTSPDVTTVMAGSSFEVSDIASDTTVVIEGVEAETAYDVYIVAADDEETPNVQSSVTLLEVTTGVQRTLSILKPVDGGQVTLGDTTWFKTQTENLDSLKLWIYFDFSGMYIETGQNYRATPDSFAFVMPEQYSFASSYKLYLSDYLDDAFTSDTIEVYPLDETPPTIDSILPENNSEASLTPTFKLFLNEVVEKGTEDSIMIYRKSDNALIEAVNVASEKVKLIDLSEDMGAGIYMEADFTFETELEQETSYYIMISEGAFKDKHGNEFSLLNDTIWSITTMGQQDIFFSEYTEGSSHNKALEIYNPTSESKSLAHYILKGTTNASENWEDVYGFPADAEVSAGDVFVIVNSQASDELKDVADWMSSGSEANFNGNDARGLFKVLGADTVLVDRIGTPENPSGDDYAVAGVEAATKNHTLIRKYSVTSGNIDWETAAGTNAEDSEWKVFDKDNFVNLGTPTPTGSTDAEILEFTYPGITVSTTIDSIAATIECGLVYTSRLDSLFPVFTLSSGATSGPASGDSLDLSDNLMDTIVVTAEDGITQKAWQISVVKATSISSDNDIADIGFEEEVAPAVFDNENHVIDVYLAYGTDLTMLEPTLTLSPGATSLPATGEIVDFSGDTTSIVVSAEDGTEQAWKVVMHTYIEVGTLAEFRAHEGSDAAFKITGELVLTAQMDFKGQKFLQDGTAGIHVYDGDGLITTAYKVGDGIKGLTGKISDYNGVIELIPVDDPGAASSENNTVEPQEISVVDLNENYDNYESELIQLKSVTFSEEEGATFENGTNYDIAFGENTTVCRIGFYDTDLTGTTIPDSASITGVAAEYNGQAQIFPRSLADVEELRVVSTDATLSDLKIDDVTLTGFVPEVTTYTVALPAGTTTVPTVTYTTENSYAIAQLTNATHLPGTTTVVVTAEDGTTTQTYSIEFSVLTTSVQNTSIADVVLYPTTVEEELYLKNADMIEQVEIINLSGVVLKRIENNNKETLSIDVSSLKSSIYVLKAISGDKVKALRFIKQ